MELRDGLRVLRSHWLAIVVLAALGFAAAFVWASVQPRVYTADASGYVSAGSSRDDLGAALVGDNLARAKVRSYLDVGSWREVAEQVIAELGLSRTPESLVRDVGVSNPIDTVVIKVVASADSPERARDIAEAWIRAMRIEIAKIEGATADQPAAVTLIPGDSARLPTSPTSPNVPLALLLGGMVGLGVGIGYAMLRHVLDRRVRTPDAVERETGLPVVGEIPIARYFDGDNRLLPPESRRDAQAYEVMAVAEALRKLRTNLQFMNVDRPPRIIVMTSPLQGDGKSVTSANLAITLAAGGQRVVLIDADLRRPTVAAAFRLLEGVGVSDLLAGRAEFSDVAQVTGPGGNLTVLGSGQTPPNPSEVLGSERMRALLTKLAQHAIVIVDAPPLLPVTDAAVLAAHADGTFIVATVGRTSYEMLERSQQILERVGARTLGVILNRVPRKRRSEEAYYRYQPAATATRRARTGRQERHGSDPGAPGPDGPMADAGSRRARRR